MGIDDLTDHLSTPRLMPLAELRALRIAPRAREALRAGSNWKLLSRHRHALNFVDSAGTLLSFTQDRIRMGPFSIEVESIPSGLSSEDDARPIPIEMDSGSRVKLGGLTLDLTSAVEWDPHPRWPSLAATPWQFDFLPMLLTRLQSSAPRESLARIVDDQGLRAIHHDRQQLGDSSSNAGGIQGLPQSAAAGSALQLVRAVVGGDDRGAASAAGALTGMGSGLTPSGDDFLIGVMFGLRSGHPDIDAAPMIRVVYLASTGRTNRVSQAWLSAAAEGEAGQGWHDLVESILSKDRRWVDRACNDLIHVGHTSGADALAGFLALHLARVSHVSG
jgi:hypothetical protein